VWAAPTHVRPEVCSPRLATKKEVMSKGKKKIIMRKLKNRIQGKEGKIK